MSRDYDFLKMLLSNVSPSGCEADLIEKWAERFKNNPYVDLCYTDKLGQKGLKVGCGPTTIVLGAHIDSVFARVMYIDKNGLLHLKHTGGTDREAFVCNEVIVLGKNGHVHGIAGKAPIHLEYKQEEHDYDDLEKVVVNVGAETKEEAEKLGIVPGVPVVYGRKMELQFGSNRMYGTDLDDKIGVYIITKILEDLALNREGDWAIKYTVIVMPLCQEEVGGMGAIRAAKNLNPDICFNFDVEHAQDNNTVKDTEAGDVELGKGGIIAYGCDKSQRILDLLIKTCDAKGIKYQTCASRNRGTDTVKFQTEASDCETMLVSIPNTYMHTPVEVCDWRDIESIIAMVTEIIKSCEL